MTQIAMVRFLRDRGPYKVGDIERMPASAAEALVKGGAAAYHSAAIAMEATAQTVDGDPIEVAVSGEAHSNGDKASLSGHSRRRRW